MEILEGQLYPVELTKYGGSYFILINRDFLDYLGADPEKTKLIVKADKGKWGRYLGIGKDKR